MGTSKTSNKLKKTGTNTRKLLLPLLSNENFLRYSKFLINDPLNNDVLDIDLKSDIIDNDENDGLIVLKPFAEEVLTESKVKIFLNPERPKNLKEVIGTITYTIDIIIPIKYWILHGRGDLRAYLIAYEIAKSIDQQKINEIGEVEIIDYTKPYSIGKSFAGISLIIEVGTVNQKG